MRFHDGALTIDTPRTDVQVIRVTGALDGATGARLLRLIDARLQVSALGVTPTRHILVDLTEVRAATVTGLKSLTRADHATRSRRLGFSLVGAGRLTVGLQCAARQVMRDLVSFPDLTAALAALPPPRPGRPSTRPRARDASPAPAPPAQPGPAQTRPAGS